MRQKKMKITHKHDKIKPTRKKTEKQFLNPKTKKENVSIIRRINDGEEKKVN